jgi:hypothetical protein
VVSKFGCPILAKFARVGLLTLTLARRISPGPSTLTICSLVPQARDTVAHRATVGSGGNAGDESRRDGTGAARLNLARSVPPSQGVVCSGARSFAHFEGTGLGLSSKIPFATLIPVRIREAGEVAFVQELRPAPFTKTVRDALPAILRSTGRTSVARGYSGRGAEASGAKALEEAADWPG